MTADGSINCANQPDEQESLVGQLIFCEAVAAMNLLCQGGNFVFKMFTALEHQMVSLMYLLACVFQEIQVIKPGRNMYITHCAAYRRDLLSCMGYLLCHSEKRW